MIHIVAYANCAVNVIIGCVVKPVLICKICGYRAREVVFVMLRCLLVMVLAVPLPLVASRFINSFSMAGFIALGAICVVCTALSVLAVGLDRQMRAMVLGFARKNTRFWIPF